MSDRDSCRILIVNDFIVKSLPIFQRNVRWCTSCETSVHVPACEILTKWSLAHILRCRSVNSMCVFQLGFGGVTKFVLCHSLKACQNKCLNLWSPCLLHTLSVISNLWFLVGFSIDMMSLCLVCPSFISLISQWLISCKADEASCSCPCMGFWFSRDSFLPSVYLFFAFSPVSLQMWCQRLELFQTFWESLNSQVFVHCLRLYIYSLTLLIKLKYIIKRL